MLLLFSDSMSVLFLYPIAMELSLILLRIPKVSFLFL